MNALDKNRHDPHPVVSGSAGAWPKPTQAASEDDLAEHLCIKSMDHGTLL